MKPLISVIVPIYKVEAYLDDCVNSLLRQTLKNIEIILVDDGSPDRCGEMCDVYAAKDKRIRVIHQENQGLSAARNAGIDAAQADYLMFVDSDDWVEENFCSHPYELALEHHADLVVFQHQRTTRPFQSCDEPSGPIDEATLQKLMLYKIGCYAWNKLYRRTLFDTVRFPVGKVYEDIAVTHILVHKANRLYYSNKILYHYRIRPYSIVTGQSKNSLYDHFRHMHSRAEALDAWGFHDLAAELFISIRWVHLLRFGCKDTLGKEHLHYFRTMKGYPSGFSWRAKRMLDVLRLSPCLYHILCRLFRRRC